MSEDFNMSMRKFLKQVGVTSQQAIEKALRRNVWPPVRGKDGPHHQRARHGTYRGGHN